MDTIGQRIARLRKLKGWSRPELGRQMAKAIARKKPFSGELIRLYEEGENEPGKEARRALAAVFGKDEAYIEFGQHAGASATVARSPDARYSVQPTQSVDVELLQVVLQGVKEYFDELDEEPTFAEEAKWAALMYDKFAGSAAPDVASVRSTVQRYLKLVVSR